MKKILCQILLIALVFGAIDFVPAFASSGSREAIEFIQSKDLWKAGVAYPCRNCICNGEIFK